MNKHGIELDTPAIRAFCSRWKIEELSVFGSILRDDFRPQSDIDFLVRFEACSEVESFDLLDEIRMCEELSEIMGRGVDLVDRSVIETTSNRFIRAELLGTAEPVYVR